jgi:two-component system nitrogen regulation response regulator GlnG
MILLIEDETIVSTMLKASIEAVTTFQVVIADTLAKALQLLRECHYVAVITDLNLPDSQGEDTLKAIVNQCSSTPIIVITGGDSICTYERAIFLGAQDFVEKTGMSVSELIRVIRKSIARHKVRKLFQPIEHEIEEAEKLIQRFKATHV